MKKKLGKFLALFVALIAFLLLMKPYFHDGIPFTHDGNNHLVRFANYKVAVKEGQIPPRFAPNLFNRYGYPVFNYNYPLANILSLPFSVLNIHYELTFKILVGLFFLTGAAGVWFWLDRLKIRNKSLKFLAISSLFISPYALNLVYVRGNIGAIMALNLFPWLLALVDHLLSKQKISRLWQIMYLATGAAFFLSHNISVMFGLGLLMVYALFRFGLSNNFKRNWLKLIAYILGWTGLSLWFWLPAMFEKHLVILDYVDLSRRYLKHFPSLNQLIFAPVEFGFSHIGSIDSLSFALGFVNLLAVVGLSLVAVKQLVKKKKLNLNWQIVLVVISWLLFIFQLPLTKPLWQILPLVNYIQFPWRLALFFVIFSLPLVAIVLKNKNFQILFAGLLLLQLGGAAKLKAVDYRYKNPIDYDLFAESTSTQNENRAATFTYEDIPNWQPGAEIIQGQGQVKVERWAGSFRHYQLNLETEAVIVEPTMNFAGWKTWANGEEVVYLDDQIIAGRISYELPAGDYQIKTRFTQQTWPRIIGNGLSLVGVLALVGYSGWSLINLIKNKHDKN